MDQAGTIRTSDWKDGFLFVGHHLALDFLNTCPVQNGEPMELLPDFSALLRWFQAAELLSARDVENLQQKWGRSARAQRTVEAVRDLRERLRKEVLAWERGGALHQTTTDQLNRLMADHPMRTRLKATGSAAVAAESIDHLRRYLTLLFRAPRNRRSTRGRHETGPNTGARQHGNELNTREREPR